MAVLRIRDENGQVYEIVVLRGEKGDKGDTGYTPQKGVDYYTDAEKQALILEINTRDVDQELANSPRAVSNWAVLEKFIEHEQWLGGLSSYDYELYTRLEEVDQQLGDIDAALDGILAIQSALIGGVSV